jgi:hypothetical protein
VLAAFLVKVTWLRPVAVVLAAIAICVPYLVLRASLGHPNPHPVPGRYEMYAVKQDTKNRLLYLLVAERGGAWPPRLFSMPMSPRDQQGSDSLSSGRSHNVVDITIGDDDRVTVSNSEGEYDLPDPDKEAYYRKLRESGK